MKGSVPTVKHGGESVMVVACFSGFGICHLHKIDKVMDGLIYKDILE